ncbi:MAG: hypothetical protein MJ137_02845 [Clostridia bacterium]|nr:hypothetical protein [Clostridia bacterium]
MKNKQLLCFAAVCVLLCAVLLSACERQPADGGGSASSAAESEPPRMLLLTGSDSPSCIVAPIRAVESSYTWQAASYLQRTVRSVTGVTLRLTTDYDKDPDGQRAEILIGETDRPAANGCSEGLGSDECRLLQTGNKLIVTGGSEAAVKKGVIYLADNYLSPEGLKVPEGMDLKVKFEMPPKLYLLSQIRTLSSGDKGINANDIVRLITALQGITNRDASEYGFWTYQLNDTQDQFWLSYISGDQKLLDCCERERIPNWKTYWKTFGGIIRDHGMVVWDPDVPATANAAETVCSVEGWLPVKYSDDPSSLYAFLRGEGVEVRLDLVGKFTGSGTVPDTELPSSGSAKCDAYLWAMEKYLSRCSGNMLAYVLDGASAVPGNPIYQSAPAVTPEYNQLLSHDYYIMNRCFFVDLTSTEGERPCDDPGQPLGTDAATLRRILSAMQKNNGGKMTVLMGFPPWYMKYTTFGGHSTLLAPTELEWAFVEVLSEYNFVKEADAAMPSWMSNASVFCHYEAHAEYKNTVPSDTRSYEPNTRYFTVYMGDYDSSAWLKEHIPTYFRDSGRGKYPLMWGFNPNLSDRVPMIFDYIYENLTPNDFIVTGDSGAGYVIPSKLADLEEWVRYNGRYLEKFDMNVVGFIINANNRLTNDIFEAYSRIAPVGSFHNDPMRKLTVWNDKTVYLYMFNSLDPKSSGAAATAYSHMTSVGVDFTAYRTIVNTPADVNAFIEKTLAYANGKNDGYRYEYVDPYTLLRLALESGQGEHLK